MLRDTKGWRTDEVSVSVSGRGYTRLSSGSTGSSFSEYRELQWLLWVWTDGESTCAGRLSDLRIIPQPAAFPGCFPVTCSDYQNRAPFVCHGTRRCRLRIQQGLACDGFAPSFLLPVAIHCRTFYANRWQLAPVIWLIHIFRG